jgi:hypothetical protein
MKTTSLVAVVFALGLAHTAEARHRSFAGGSDYSSNGQFGLGLELGEPSGLNGKLFLTPNQALDFGIGEIYNYGPGDGLHLYIDYLWHPKELVQSEAFKLAFYIGVGGRIWFFDYDNMGNARADVFGLRVPIGIDFDFNNVPLDVFVQLVPTLDFYHNYRPHDVYLDVDFSVGIRFWFS